MLMPLINHRFSLDHITTAFDPRETKASGFCRAVGLIPAPLSTPASTPVRVTRGSDRNGRWPSAERKEFEPSRKSRLRSRYLTPPQPQFINKLALRRSICDTWVSLA
jgi:hypothetical protein